MQHATTRLGLWMLAIAFVAVPALAQETSEVTFQVDMSAAIENCVLPQDGIVTVRGSFNAWGEQDEDYTLTHGDDNIFAGTFEVPHGDIQYKFWGSGDVDWEHGDNRTATITDDVTFDVATFNKTFEDQCTAVRETFDVVFEVDMSVQRRIGNFDPDVDRVFLASPFTGWQDAVNNPDFELTEDIATPDLYTGVIPAELTVPSENNLYKFIIQRPDGAITWESGDNRTFAVTGDEEDADGDGTREVIVERRFFSDVDAGSILDAPATVRIEVDLRPAYYYLMDHDTLPGEESGDEIQGLFINGPIAGSSNEDTADDWAGWSAEGLGQIETRRLRPTTASDSVYTITFTYPANTPTRLIGKFGINGYDNEAQGFVDHHIDITEGDQTIQMIFGCMRRADGTFNSTHSPAGVDRAYAPYLNVNNAGAFSTCAVVRAGGMVGVEPVGPSAGTLTLSANYPNPFATQTTFEYAVPTATRVSLEVYDLMGRRVATLVDEVQAANTYRVSFDASSLASGTYVYRLTAGEQAVTQKMTVIR